MLRLLRRQNAPAIGRKAVDQKTKASRKVRDCFVTGYLWIVCYDWWDYLGWGGYCGPMEGTNIGGSSLEIQRKLGFGVVGSE